MLIETNSNRQTNNKSCEKEAEGFISTSITKLQNWDPEILMVINLHEGIYLKHSRDDWYLTHATINANHYSYYNIMPDLSFKVYFLSNLLPKLTVLPTFQFLEQKHNLFINIIFCVPDTLLDIEDNTSVNKTNKNLCSRGPLPRSMRTDQCYNL